MPLKENYTIREITPQDNPEVERIIQVVMPEFGCIGPGFALNDPELSNMFEAYQEHRSRYFVLVKDNKVVGGAGIAPLAGGNKDTCELRKMYFLPSARGSGMGKKLLTQCLEAAKKFNYTKCYLETFTGMNQAQGLYQHLGFKKLTKPMGSTGHHACDHWYLKELY